MPEGASKTIETEKTAAGFIDRETGFSQTAREKLKRELGPQILGYLGDPTVIEIMVNSDGRLFVQKLGEPAILCGQVPATQVQAVLETVAAFCKRTINPTNPILETELPFYGSRLLGVVPPVTIAPKMTIRKPALKIFTLEDYVADGIMTPAQKDILSVAARERKNIVVVGGTGTGKTTLTNAILEMMERMTPHHRFLIVEDTRELQCRAANRDFYKTNPPFVTMEVILKTLLRDKPDRIIVGEVRGGEALQMLKLWNTGHPGGICTVHANSARGGLLRLEQCVQEVSTNPQRIVIGEAVDLVVYIGLDDQHRRRVQEIIAVEGVANDDYILSDCEQTLSKKIKEAC